jgi:hypothetical protein
MHADVLWTSPPSGSGPNSNQGNAHVDIAQITVLLVFSAVIQFCSLFVLYLMADKVSALLNAYMIVHYEKIAKWKYGGNTASHSTATPMSPVAVTPLR